METIFVTLAAVAFAEIGDKTQLLAILLAARFRAPIPIALGILTATLANHVLAATLGVVAGAWLSADMLRWVLVVSFVAMAAWTLLPDKMDGEPALFSKFGAFGATLISFFLIEMGDKTQIATIALAARFQSVFLVTMGSTLGIMVADVPAIYFGHALTKRVPLKLMRTIAAGIFLSLALAAILDWGRRFLFA